MQVKYFDVDVFPISEIGYQYLDVVSPTEMMPNIRFNMSSIFACLTHAPRWKVRNIGVLLKQIGTFVRTGLGCGKDFSEKISN